MKKYQNSLWIVNNEVKTNFADITVLFYRLQKNDSSVINLIKLLVISLVINLK